MRRLIFVLTSIGLLFFSIKILSKNTKTNSSKHSLSYNSTEEKLLNRVDMIKKFISNNPKYNSEIAFLVDMKIMSGKNGESLSKWKQYLKEIVVDKLMAYNEIFKKLSRYNKLMQYKQYLSKIVQNWKKNSSRSVKWNML